MHNYSRQQVISKDVKPTISGYVAQAQCCGSEFQTWETDTFSYH